MESTRLKDIYKHLKSFGFSVYFPAQHKGECTEPYIVLKEVTTSQYLQYSSTVTYYDLMCYVPKDKFSMIEDYMNSVKECMKAMVPMIKPTYNETQSFYDDGIKGHMKSVQYKNYKQIT